MFEEARQAVVDQAKLEEEMGDLCCHGRVELESAKAGSLQKRTINKFEEHRVFRG